MKMNHIDNVTLQQYSENAPEAVSDSLKTKQHVHVHVHTHTVYIRKCDYVYTIHLILYYVCIYTE